MQHISGWPTFRLAWALLPPIYHNCNKPLFPKHCNKSQSIALLITVHLIKVTYCNADKGVVDCIVTNLNVVVMRVDNVVLSMKMGAIKNNT